VCRTGFFTTAKTLLLYQLKKEKHALEVKTGALYHRRMIVYSYKQLIVWQRSVELVSACYALTNTFPKEEQYCMKAQMRRAAISIPSNIAEGRSMRSTNDFVRYLRMAFGSGAELETQIEIMKRTHIVPAEHAQDLECLLDEVMRMLNVMIRKLQSKT